MSDFLPSFHVLLLISDAGESVHLNFRVQIHLISTTSEKFSTEQVQLSIIDSTCSKVYHAFPGDPAMAYIRWFPTVYALVNRPPMTTDNLLRHLAEFCPDSFLHIRLQMLVSSRPQLDDCEFENGYRPPQNKRFKRTDDLFDMMIELTPDVTLKLNDGSELKVNSQKLMKCSTEFTDLLSSEKLAKSNGIIEITDVSRKVMIELLRFIYCGQVRALRQNGTEIFEAACKYKITNLVDECTKAVGPLALGEKNVLRIAQLANSNNSEKLFDSCCIVIKL